MTEKQEYDVIIIGGGPAGMMAAGTIINNDTNAKVLLIEKNKNLGEKLSITGGGRCNITNAIFDNKELVKKYGKADKFLHSAFSKFSVQDTFDFFEKMNLPLVIQEYGRVFPKSEKAIDVTNAMIKYCTNSRITIKTNTTISKIISNKSVIEFVETTKGERYTAKSYILATGGLSRPETGSTGDGFNWLKTLGHKVQNPTPTLAPWTSPEIWIHDNAGKTIDNCKITVEVNNKKYFSFNGRILLTHTGISGPVVINNANKLQDAIYSGEIQTYLDLYPDKNHKEVDELILEIFEKNKNKKLKNVINEIIKINSNENFFIKNLPADMEMNVHSVSKDFRKSLVQLLKKIPIKITGIEGYAKSIVADGGVSLTEVDTKTMKSKIISNLFITGDLLDIRRPSGGYSLQLCWTTGYVAGINSLQK